LLGSSSNKTTYKELDSINRRVEGIFQKLKDRLVDQDRYLLKTPLHRLKTTGIIFKEEWIYQATKALEALSA
jgi:hypothetical protein